ncbi:MAG: hypothetical protein K2O03_09825 [Lachnospiraceae bacterium]|nr:hypothetical protein [Lachnospiraceae bacterium]
MYNMWLKSIKNLRFFVKNVRNFKKCCLYCNTKQEKSKGFPGKKRKQSEKSEQYLAEAEIKIARNKRWGAKNVESSFERFLKEKGLQTRSSVLPFETAK